MLSLSKFVSFEDDSDRHLLIDSFIYPFLPDWHHHYMKTIFLSEYKCIDSFVKNSFLTTHLKNVTVQKQNKDIFQRSTICLLQYVGQKFLFLILNIKSQELKVGKIFKDGVKKAREILIVSIQAFQNQLKGLFFNLILHK